MGMQVCLQRRRRDGTRRGVVIASDVVVQHPAPAGAPADAADAHGGLHRTDSLLHLTLLVGRNRGGITACVPPATADPGPLPPTECLVDVRHAPAFDQMLW